jgi:radical SAM protein with 4Fe4S-binding SPASM domain
MIDTFIQVFLGLTYNCNLNCPHCYAKDRRTKNEMNYNQLKSLINQLHKMRIFKIVLSHGENLLRRDFFDIAAYIRSKGIHLTLITNGTTINENVLKKLKRIGVNKVMVSLDSCKPEKHDKFRGVPGTWLKAVNALKLIKRENMRSSMAVALTPLNSKEIDNLINLGLKLGTDEISFLTVRPTSCNENFSFDKNEYNTLIKKIWGKKQKLKNKIEILIHDPLAIPLLIEAGYKPTDDLIGLNTCGAGRLFLSIDPEGNVRPCNFLPLIIGNVKKQKLIDICTKSKDLKSYKLIPKVCKSCKYNEYCTGGCKAFSLQTGNSFAKDPRCWR